ncbi:MAG: hypothetical protein JNL50_09430 [Phycisphaerae bacterium]|nr:hypothetical protein [Phycisphaerae bacterium]
MFIENDFGVGAVAANQQANLTSVAESAGLARKDARVSIERHSLARVRALDHALDVSMDIDGSTGIVDEGNGAAAVAASDQGRDTHERGHENRCDGLGGCVGGHRAHGTAEAPPQARS